MEVTARIASPDDVESLTELYALLESEMIPLHPMWPKADGLPTPISDALAWHVAADDSVVVVGEIDGHVFGFMIGMVESLLEHVEEDIAAIRYVFTELPAREVGVGEAMLDLMMDQLRDRGIVRFDAHVLPGHRLVKNFFESGGFSARSIVMHHDDMRIR